MPWLKNLDPTNQHQHVNDTKFTSRRRKIPLRFLLPFLFIFILNFSFLPITLCARRRSDSNRVFGRLRPVTIQPGDLQYLTRDGKLLRMMKVVPLRHFEKGHRDERERRGPRPARPRERRRDREWDSKRLRRLLTRLLDRGGRRGEERKKTVYDRQRYDGRYKDPRKRTKRKRKENDERDESHRRRRILTKRKDYRRTTLTRTISREADGPRIRTLRGRLVPLRAPGGSRYVYTVIASPYGQMKIDKDDWILGEGPLMRPRWTRKDQGEFEAIWKEDEEESEEGRTWMHLLVHRRIANNTKSKGRWKEFKVREMDDQEPLDRVFLFDFDAETVEVLRTQRNILNSLKKRIDTRKILGPAWKKADEDEDDDDDDDSSDESSSSSTDDDKEEEEDGEGTKSKWRMRKRSKTPKRRKRAKSKEVKKENK